MRLKLVPPDAKAWFTVKLPLTAWEKAPEKQIMLQNNKSHCLDLDVVEIPVVGKIVFNFLANETLVEVEIIME